MKKIKKAKLFKIILSIVVLAIIIGIIIYLIPVIKNISTVEGRIEFKEKIQNSGLMGFITIIALQFAQIFLIIIPGEPIEILAGVCYGGLWGTVFIMVSSCIISIMIFSLVRILGRRFVYNFYDKKRIKELEKNQILQNPKKIEYIMFILFLMPGTPKDLLVYLAGLLPIKPVRFIVISTIARFPSVITSTLAGANLIKRRMENGNNNLCYNICNSWCYCIYNE